MIHLLNKGQKKLFFAGILVIAASLYYISMPAEIEQWTPENFRIDPELAGTDYGPSITMPEVGYYIEKRTGLGYQSLEVFRKKGYDKNEVIIVKGLLDGKSMFISEKEQLFTLQDNSPNLFTSLEPQAITEKNGKVMMSFGAGGDIIPIFGLFVLVWALIVLHISYPKEEIYPGQAVYG